MYMHATEGVCVVCVCVCERVCICVYVCVCVRECACAHIYVSLYLCI